MSKIALISVLLFATSSFACEGSKKEKSKSAMMSHKSKKVAAHKSSSKEDKKAEKTEKN